MIKKITIQILIVSLLFVLAPRAMAEDATVAGDIRFYSQVAESNRIFEYLTSNGVRVWEVNQLLDFIARLGYFEKPKAEKIRIINQIFRQQRTSFWQDMPLVLIIESSAVFGAGDRSVDYYYNRCNTDEENSIADRAAIFFVNAYCHTGGSDFPSKDKWSAQDLDALYGNFWSDLANQRYMPIFSKVETGRLRAFGAVMERLQSGGTNCGQMEQMTQSVLQDQTAVDIFFRGSSVLGLGIAGAEVAAGSVVQGLLAVVRDHVITRVSEGATQILFANRRARILRVSGVPFENWPGEYDRMEGLFRQATTPGKLNPMTDAAAIQYLQSNIEVIPQGEKMESPAKFDGAGNLTEPMKVNNQHALWGQTLDGRSINGFYPASIRHEIIHSAEAAQLPIKNTNYPNLMNTYGMTPGANLSSEMWTEFFAQYELGTIKSRGDIETLIASGNYAYLDNMLRYAGGVTAQIQTSRGVSFDQAVGVAWDRYRGADGGLSAMYWDFMPHGVYQNAQQLYNYINVTLARRIVPQ